MSNSRSLLQLVLGYVSMSISIGAELGGAAGARAPPLFNPRPEIYSTKCA